VADDKTVVRRVKADTSAVKADRKPSTKTKKTAVKSSAKSTAKSKSRSSGRKQFFLLRPILAFGRYFRNSWRELRQVHWTNRRATWALTLAVILFSAFFAIFILLFDWLFQWLIKEVIL
jgi:preprotein translocase SecE subunit